MTSWKSREQKDGGLTGLQSREQLKTSPLQYSLVTSKETLRL
ncbi:MAG TPA: hypothetical protein VMT42_01685 [candidate division Zixibacteria bacterium]|nr:hypothetical protein [candidate division Zixibacteria bacterium]